MINLFPVLDSWLHWLQRNRMQWLTPLLIAGVVLLSVALAFLDLNRYVFFPLTVALLLLAFVPVVGGGLIILRSRPLGLVALIVGGMFVPLEIGTGSGSSINISLLLVALLLGLWLLEFITGRRELWRGTTVELPLLLFVVVAISAFFVGQLPWFTFAPQKAPLTAQIAGLAIFVLSTGAFLLVAHEIRELRWLEWLTWAFLAMGGLFMVARLLPGVGWRITSLYQSGTYDHAMFWTWLVAMALGQAIFNKRMHLLWRIVLLGIVALTLYIAYFLNFGWKSGWLPALVVIVVIVGLRSWRISTVAAVAGLMVVPGLLSEVVATDEYSYSTRVDAWLLMLEMIKTSPILGFGPANYYWYTPLFPIRGYSVVFNSHSQYLDIIAQTGVLGLIVLLWFFARVGKLGLALRRKAPEGFAQGYVHGVLGGFAGTLAAGLLVDWFFPFVYNIGLRGFRSSVLPWLFLGGLVSIKWIIREQTNS